MYRPGQTPRTCTGCSTGDVRCSENDESCREMVRGAEFRMVEGGSGEEGWAAMSGAAKTRACVSPTVASERAGTTGGDANF